MTDQQSVQNLINIGHFFSHPKAYFKRTAAMMLADKVIPGMHEVMSDEFVGDREMEHSYQIFLALKREQ